HNKDAAVPSHNTAAWSLGGKQWKQNNIQSSHQPNYPAAFCRLEWRNKESSILSYRLQLPSLKLTVRCGLCAPQVEYHYSKRLCAILTPSRRRTLQEPSHYG